MNTIEKKSLSVGKYVNNQHVDAVIRNYKQERWIHNSERLGKEDSLSGWWSIEEVEQFLETAKMHGSDGIKLYFGAYPKDYAENPEYAGLQTLVMVGTKQRNNGDGTVSNKDVYVNGENGSTILAYNHNALCPPNCRPGTSPATTITEDIDYDYNDDMDLGILILDKGADGMVVI